MDQLVKDVADELRKCLGNLQATNPTIDLNAVKKIVLEDIRSR